MNSILAFDFSILDFIQNNIRCEFLDFIMPPITYLGSGGFIWIAIGIIMLGFKKTRMCGVGVLVALIACLLIGNLGLKPIVARERPCWINQGVDMLVAIPRDYSFPSGHTMSSFAAAFIILDFNKKYGTWAIILATLIAFSRLYLYVHFPTDIISAIFIAGIIYIVIKHFIVPRIYPFLERKVFKK